MDEEKKLSTIPKRKLDPPSKNGRGTDRGIKAV